MRRYTEKIIVATTLCAALLGLAACSNDATTSAPTRSLVPFQMSTPESEQSALEYLKTLPDPHNFLTIVSDDTEKLALLHRTCEMAALTDSKKYVSEIEAMTKEASARGTSYFQVAVAAREKACPGGNPDRD